MQEKQISPLEQIQYDYITLAHGVKIGLFDRDSAAKAWRELKAEERKYADSSNQ